MNNTITDEKLAKYFKITKEALDMASKAEKSDEEKAADALDMISRYISDAEHFKSKGEYVLAYGALNYAHGWLDCGARMGFFKVNDSRLFTVDDE